MNGKGPYGPFVVSAAAAGFFSRWCHRFRASVTYGIHNANKTVYR